MASVDVSESSKFYEVIPDNMQVVEEVGRYHILSLRRVLRNKGDKNVRRNILKKICGEVSSCFGFYSSSNLTRSLRNDKRILEMIEDCDEPFSLLGKFQSHDYDNSNGEVEIVTRPILVIPGVKDMGPIYDWEDKHTKYKTEGSLF